MHTFKDIKLYETHSSDHVSLPEHPQRLRAQVQKRCSCPGNLAQFSALLQSCQLHVPCPRTDSRAGTTLGLEVKTSSFQSGVQGLSCPRVTQGAC